jgi:hypothetical protein
MIECERELLPSNGDNNYDGNSPLSYLFVDEGPYRNDPSLLENITNDTCQTLPDLAFINLITAGTLRAMSSVNVLNGAFGLVNSNVKFLDGLKAAGMTGLMARQVIFQAAMYGLNAFTRRQAEDYMDHNSGQLESDAKQVSQGIVDANYDPYLRRIFANDAASGV